LKPTTLSQAIATAALVLSLWGCSRAPVVTVKNESGRELQNVVLSGSGFTESIGTLGPAATHSVSPRVRGESGIRLQFDTAGQHYDSGEQGYFETSGGYHVSVAVDRQMKVAVDGKLN
jgi:hypothetical protein